MPALQIKDMLISHLLEHCWSVRRDICVCSNTAIIMKWNLPLCCVWNILIYPSAFITVNSEFPSRDEESVQSFSQRNHSQEWSDPDYITVVQVFISELPVALLDMFFQYKQLFSARGMCSPCFMCPTAECCQPFWTNHPDFFFLSVSSYWQLPQLSKNDTDSEISHFVTLGGISNNRILAKTQPIYLRVTYVKSQDLIPSSVEGQGHNIL